MIQDNLTAFWVFVEVEGQIVDCSEQYNYGSAFRNEFFDFLIGKFLLKLTHLPSSLLLLN